MLADGIHLLLCPHCGSDLDVDGREVICERGHTFDIARQGYVSLLPGSAGKIVGDSADMVADRAAFLDSGRYDPIMDAVADAAGSPIGVLLDVGSGTGHYLARVLGGAPDAVGIGVDVSKFAARRAAHAHPRIASVVADVWDHLPVRAGAVDVVTSIFSPRNPAELRRVLADGGRLVVVTPTDRHLVELVDSLDLIGVDSRKTQRLGDALSGLFERVHRTPLTFTMELDRVEVAALVGMGPSARHGAAERVSALESLPETTSVTASVVVGVYEPATTSGLRPS